MRKLILAVLCFAACSSDSTKDVRPYTDQAGHMCTVDVHDISATATCNVAPAEGCTGGAVACWTVAPDTMTNVLRNCAACCDVANHQTFIDGSMCAGITCTTAADCLYDNATCSSGVCHE